MEFLGKHRRKIVIWLFCIAGVAFLFTIISFNLQTGDEEGEKRAERPVVHKVVLLREIPYRYCEHSPKGTKFPGSQCYRARVTSYTPRGSLTYVVYASPDASFASDRYDSDKEGGPLLKGAFIGTYAVPRYGTHKVLLWQDPRSTETLPIFFGQDIPSKGGVKSTLCLEPSAMPTVCRNWMDRR